MKKLILLFTILLFIGCKEKVIEKEYNKNDKTAIKAKKIVNKTKIYNKGETVFVKPDSIRAVIVHVNYEDSEELRNYDIDFYIAGERQHVEYINGINFY